MDDLTFSHIDDMPNKSYHQAEGISKSILDLAHKAPALIEWSLNAPVDPAGLEVFDFGTAVHCAILEPERFSSEYIQAPNVDRRTTKGKDEYAEFIESAKGKNVLSPEEFSQVQFMRDSALAHPDFKSMHDAGFSPERSLFWKDSRTGMLCKARPDMSLNDHPVVIDIKTTGNVERFDKSIAEYRYHVQDAHYSIGAELYYKENVSFYFLAISKSISGGKYPVRLFALHEEDKDQGIRERNQDMETIFQCQTTGEWTGLETIRLPRWARDDTNGGI